MPTNQTQFDSVNDIFREGNKVFVIPVFQRPYAWEEQHIQTLIDDIDTASQRKPKPFHYLSPIHVIEIKEPKQKEWRDYTDDKNDDIQRLNKSDFQTDTGSILKVYLVIDGQQRLTTLFSLLWGINKDRLQFQCGQYPLPRIILNPPHDHYAFRKYLGLPSNQPSISSRAQERLKICFAKSIAEHKQFIYKGGLKLLLVELNAYYGLQAFQTQNDRGKPLTTLEKLKSLMMEYDLNKDCNYVSKIHSCFGHAYQVLDRKDCLVSENDFIQLLSIIMRITSDTDSLWQSADNAYDVYFNKKLKILSKNRETCQLLDDWINTGKSIIEQIHHVGEMIAGKIAQPSCILPGSKTRDVADDYRFIFQSLGLNIRNYAVLFKIRQKYPDIEWHAKSAKITVNNKSIIDIITSKLNNIKAEAGDNAPDIIKAKINEIHTMIQTLQDDDNRKKELSALEVVERIQLFILDMGSSYPSGFGDYWKWAFNKSSDIDQTLNRWYGFATSYWTDNKARFIENLFSDNLQEKIRNYILKEYESFKFDRNIHFNKKLHIEHIFPQEPTPKPPRGYFPSHVTAFDYDKWITKIGNLVYLDGSLNESIKKNLPEIKASAYVDQSHNKIVVPPENRVHTSIDVGKNFDQIKNTQFFRIYLELRNVELAIFAAKRFY